MRTSSLFHWGSLLRFQSTRPLRGETGRELLHVARRHISIRSPLAGRDLRGRSCHRPARNFNPLAPCGARRSAWTPVWTVIADFNPLAPCGARHHGRRRFAAGLFISIRSPLAGRDARVLAGQAVVLISIRSPLAGRDYFIFICSMDQDISIRSPLAGRDSRGRTQYPLCRISIRSPLAGRDGNVTVNSG